MTEIIDCLPVRHINPSFVDDTPVLLLDLYKGGCIIVRNLIRAEP